MDLAARLQLKPGQGLCAVGEPDGGVSALDAIVTAASADRLTWVAYPKAGQLGTDLNRDSLAARLTALGVRPVRQVSIDDVWSALRFRPA